MNTLTNSDGQQLVSDEDHLALSRIITEAAWRIDEGKSSMLGELFAEQGELVMGDTVLRGKEAIQNWGIELDKAETYGCIRHVAGNMRFTYVNDHTVKGVTILTVFMDDENHSSIPWVVGEDHDTFINTKDGWRFSERKWVQLFSR